MVHGEQDMQLTILEEPNEERYLRCHLVEEFRIFNIVIDKEEAKMYEILIAIGQDLQKLQPVVNMYLEWLNNCEEELTVYIEKQLGEPLSVHWMEEIEVYAVSIVFNDVDDYGATISFGMEDVFGDHIVELDFEKCEIIGNRLIG